MPIEIRVPSVAQRLHDLRPTHGQAGTRPSKETAKRMSSMTSVVNCGSAAAVNRSRQSPEGAAPAGPLTIPSQLLPFAHRVMATPSASRWAPPPSRAAPRRRREGESLDVDRRNRAFEAHLQDEICHVNVVQIRRKNRDLGPAGQSEALALWPSSCFLRWNTFSVNKRSKLTPQRLDGSIAWRADRRRDPTPIHSKAISTVSTISTARIARSLL